MNKMAAHVLGTSWNISQKGIETITENGSIIDKYVIFKKAINSDLKEIGYGVLSKELSKSILNNVVLQIQKIRNVAAPKANENSQTAPRMLKIVLTDGESYVQAIEVAPIPMISRDKTAPGTKILVENAKFRSGFLLLDSNNFLVLGGQVPHLYEKWEASKCVQFNQNRQNNSCSDGGPPAWVNFGSKINRSIDNEDFTSIEIGKNNKENSEFDLQRQEAIAEATTGAIKKVFGGGVKQSIQNPSNHRHIKNNRDNKRNKGKSMASAFEEKPQKPMEKVSLFSFLEDKLPAVEVGTTDLPQITNNNKQYYQQNRNDYKPYQKYDNRNDYNKTRQLVHSNSNVLESENFRSVPPNKTQLKSKMNMNELSKNLGRMSLNSQFASRSLRQHLNLESTTSQKGANTADSWHWKVGDDCLAKYWEDGKYYDANITAVTDKTCVVKFQGYGNIEEVLKTDCLPITNAKQERDAFTNGKRNCKGTMEFRRSGKLPRK